MGQSAEEAIAGPLSRSARNPRYFQNASGHAIVLAGSHTWANFQDLYVRGNPVRIDYEEYLTFLADHHHNLTRLWQWDHPLIAPWTHQIVVIEPMPYQRTGAGLAADGLPRFNLDQWNAEYFRRLQHRVKRAQDRGIYILLMLFESWCVKWSTPEADAWAYHPLNAANNVNRVDGESLKRPGRAGIYTLEIPAVVERQVAFVRKVLDTVEDCDNVVLEIANETEDSPEAMAWQHYMGEVVQAYERGKRRQHPVGISATSGDQENGPLLCGPGDWIAPGHGEEFEYRNDPPSADGRKVVLSDTDHLWGHGGDYLWAWKTFLRGMNPMFMDPWYPVPGTVVDNYLGDEGKNHRDYPDWEPLRKNLGYIVDYSRRMDLNQSVPSNGLASSQYCLADPGTSYLVLCLDGESVALDLSDVTALFLVEWFNPLTDETIVREPIAGGSWISVACPFASTGVVFLHRRA